MRIVGAVVSASAVCACGSSSTATRVEPPVATTAPNVDAGIDAAIDAGVPAALLHGRAWIFRYDTPGRTETWTLRYGDGHAVIDVETSTGTTRYLGTAVEGTALAIEVSTSTTKLSLSCKNNQRPIGATCDERRAKKIAVLDCYHPEFAQPMPFGASPGVAYVETGGCKGYRRLAP